MKDFKKFGFFGDLNKSEELSDGTLKVWGIASTGNVDADGEIITSDAMKEAIPDYMKFGAVREMHGSNAAGTALEIFVDDHGITNISTLIVDPVAILKVKTGVYKGFSIGGKVIKRNANNPNEIIKIKLVEVSLVDRPANPDAIFTMYKNESLDIEEEKNDNIKIQEDNNMNDNKDKEVNTEIKKGLNDVAWLASIVSELGCLHECMEYEREWEKDDSKLPEELLNVIRQLSNLLLASAKEETDELVAEESEKNEKTDLEKAGSRHSKSDMEKMKEMYNILVSLGINEDTEEDSAKFEKSDKEDNLKKFEELNTKLEKFEKENESLSKRVKELEAMPMPTKGALFAVSKEGDQGEVVKSEKVVKKLGSDEVDEVATAILKAQQSAFRKI